MSQEKYFCAVIGNPVAHSKSPQLHSEFAQKYAINLQYDKILATEDNFAQIVETFFKNGGTGLNITVPFKERAFLLAKKLTSYAQKAEAVNTLWLENGELCGDNTDGRGLIYALNNDCGVNLKDKRILLLGAGGAAKGVIFPLLEAGAKVEIFNRTFKKAIDLAQKYPQMKAVDILKNPEPYEIIINATSSGLSDEKLDLPQDLVSSNTICYEMMYGKKTPFMIWAQEAGAGKIFDGFSMLRGQGFLSFKIWFEKKFDI